MNISKIKTTTVMTFAACTLLACFPASAQDEAKTSSVFEELETQKFTFEKAATPPVLNLGSAVNPFVDLQLSLLSVSHSDFEELRNLIATDASLSTAPKPHTVGVQKYQLTRKQVEYLDEHVRPLVKGQQALPYHTYRIARSDADFLFGQLPVAGGFPVEGRVRLHESPDYRIEPSDVLLIESALKFRSRHTAIVIGESLMVRVNRSTRSAKDESAFSRPIINSECTVGTDGYLDLGPEYGKVHVAGQPLSEIQRRVEIHLKRKLKTSQVLVSLPGVKPKQQVKGQHLVQPDGTVALGVYGDVAVAGMTLQKARQAIGRHLQHQIQDHQLHVDVLGNNRDIYYVISDSGGANEQIYTLPSTGDETVRDAIAQIKGLASAAGVQEIWIERPKPNGRGAHQVLNVGWDAISKGPQQQTNYEILPGDRLCVGTRFVAALKFETDRTRNGNRLLAGQFRLKATPDKPIDVEFSLQPQEGAESPISQMIAIPAGERVWLLTSAAKRTKQIRPNPTCTCKASIIEFSGKAMAELQELLSVTATASPAWVISDNDLSALAEFADAQVEVGSARLLSTPMVSAASGKPMRLTPDSPVSVAAGDGATVVEFDSIGVSLHATVTPVGSLSNRLEWLFGNTDRDANWSSVTRHTKGSAVVKADESILVPLPIRNDGIHVVAVLKASRAANNENQSVINEPENSDQQFAELTKKFNQLMTARRHAEAILVAEKAVELQPDNRAAIVMVEKAKLQAQIARIENTGSVPHANGGGLGRVATPEPPAIHADNSDSEVAAETSSSSGSPKVTATASQLRDVEIRYSVEGRFLEFSKNVMDELKSTLSVDTETLATWVISESDAEEFDEFAKAKVAAGGGKILSRPRMIGLSGKSMQIQIGSEVPVAVPAGNSTTAIEFKPTGIHLDVTLTPETADSDRLDWKFGKTDHEGGWSFVTRKISGQSLLQTGESIIIPLLTRNDGMHLVAVLKASRVSSGEDGSVISESVRQDQQFAELTKKFNQLMTARRHAEAILVAEKAVELQPDNRAAIVMVEKAKLQAQIARIENGGDVSNENGGGLGRVVAVEPPAIHAGNSDSEVAAETSSSSDSPKINATSTKLKTLTTDRSVRCDVGNAVRLQHSSRIKTLSGFDSAIVKVEPIQGDPNSVTVYALAEGGTQIRIVDEHDAEHLVNVLSLQFSGLDVYLKHFFPAVNVEVWPIRGSVLLRGIVGSELQKQHIIAVAELFYPQILDQLTVDASAASEAVKTDRHVPVGGELTDQSAVTITAARSSLIVPRNVARTLVFSNRIRSVDVFNSKSIKVELAQGTANRFLVNGLASGTSRLTVVDEDDQEFFVNIVVEDNVQELRFLASRLYPDLGLNFHSVKGSILVRGTVESEIQAQQVIDLAEQFSGHVLNHTQVVANSTATNLQERQTIITSDGIRTVRSDIKSLHRDVRSLIEILKTRKSVNAAAREQSTE